MTSSTIHTLRAILQELRVIFPKKELRETLAFRYLLAETREYQVTAEKTCRHRQEVSHLADTYLTFLHSSRKYKELYSRYHAGERSIEQAAKMVGLGLPPKTPPTAT